MIYLTYADFVTREGEKLPLSDDGSINQDKVNAALEDASGVIRTYLPDLIGADGLPLIPPARLSDSLKPITRDLALYFLTDMGGEEDARKRYDSAIKLLIALGCDSDDGPEALEEDDSELVSGTSGFGRPPVE